MINWLSFLVVFVTSLIGAGVLVVLYSIGVRLLATPSAAPSSTPDIAVNQTPDEDADESGRVTRTGRPLAATAGAYACFGLCGLGVLFAVYLIIPVFH